MIDKSRLEQKCSTWNIALTGTQLDQLDAFAEILVEYNQKVNLTAITFSQIVNLLLEILPKALTERSLWKRRR